MRGAACASFPLGLSSPLTAFRDYHIQLLCISPPPPRSLSPGVTEPEQSAGTVRAQATCSGAEVAGGFQRRWRQLTSRGPGSASGRQRVHWVECELILSLSANPDPEPCMLSPGSQTKRTSLPCLHPAQLYPQDSCLALLVRGTSVTTSCRNIL